MTEQVKKYNQCHGPNGRFCSGGSGGGGGGSGGKTVTAEGDMGGWLDESELSPEYLANETGVETYTMRIEESAKFDTLVVKQNVSEEEALKLVDQADGIAGKTQVQNLKKIEIAKIDQEEALAQMKVEMYPDPKATSGWIAKETLQVDMSPAKLALADKGWEQDQWAIKEKNQLPWLASGYASTAEGNRKGLIVHEIGHAVMAEHTLKQPIEKWADPDSPLQGTKEWHSIISGAAAKGWVGSSMYGRQDAGEMFAESLSRLTVVSSTGNKDVDDYVVRVVKNG